MSPVVWTPTAARDLQRHRAFLAESDVDVANRAVQAIVRMGKTLTQAPKRGRIVDEASGLRKLPVRFGKVGFVIHYAIVLEEVVILRVYHGRENRPQ